MAEFTLDLVANTEGLTQGLQNGLEALQGIGQEATKTGKEVSQAFDGKTTAGLQKSLKDSFLFLGKMEIEVRKLKTALKSATDPKDVARLNAELKNTTNSLLQFDNATDTLESSQKSLRAQLRENREILAAMEAQGLDTTQSFEQLQIATGKLQDQVNDANERIKFFASDTRGLDGAIALSRAAAAGFAVAEGSAALFGAENENVQKALLKVNAAMAILNGLQEIQAAIQKSSAARLAIENTLRRIRVFVMGQETVAMNTLTAAEKAATIGARVLRAALLATGVGAVLYLVSTLAEAAAAMSKFGDTTQSTTDLIKEQDEALQDLSDSYQFNTDKQIANAKRLGANQATLRQLEIQGMKDQIKILEKDRDDKLAIIADFEAKQIQVLKTGSNDEIKAFKEGFIEAKDAYKKSLDNLTALRRDYNLSLIEDQTATNAEVTEANNEFDEQEKRREEERRKQAEEAARIALQRTRAMLARQRQINEFIRETAKKANDELFKIQVEDEDKILNDRLSFLNDLEEFKKLELDIEFETGDKSLEEQKRIAKEKLKVELDFAQQRLAILQEAGASVVDIRAVELAIKKAQNDIADLEKPGKENPVFKALGLGGLSGEETDKVIENLNIIRDSVKSVLSEINQAAIDSNQSVINSIDERIEETKRSVERQKELADEGRSNNLQAETDHLEALQKARNESVEKQKKLLRQQLNLDTATQVSSLITAAANIFSSTSKIPIVGVPLAIAAIAAMFAAFAASQVRARQSINQQTFKHGGLVGGKRHNADGWGGNRYVSDNGDETYIERDEFIVNRMSAKKYLPLLEAINTDKLRPMLNGMGISLNEDRIEAHQRMKKQYALEEVKLKVDLENKGIAKELKAFREDYKSNTIKQNNKPEISFKDGYRIEVRGNRVKRTKLHE